MEEVYKKENNIRRICIGDPAKKMTQRITGEIMAQVECMSKMLLNMLTRNSFLKGMVDIKDSKIASLTKRLEKMQEGAKRVERPQYAKATEEGIEARVVPAISGTRKMTPTLAHTVVISPVNEKKKTDAEELKKSVMSIIDPCKDKIRINGIR